MTSVICLGDSGIYRLRNKGVREVLAGGVRIGRTVDWAISN